MLVTWLSTVLAVACLLLAGLHLLRLTVLRRPAEASHAVMAGGMAAMFSPFGNPVPVAAWTGVFVLCGVVAARRALRPGTAGALARHHLAGSVAMLLMLAGIGAHSEEPSGRGPGLASVAALVLAGYFIWHALRRAEGPVLGKPPAVAAAGDPSGVLPGQAGLLSKVTAAAAEAVMAAMMAVMLLALL